MTEVIFETNNKPKLSMSILSGFNNDIVDIHFKDVTMNEVF